MPAKPLEPRWNVLPVGRALDSQNRRRASGRVCCPFSPTFRVALPLKASTPGLERAGGVAHSGWPLVHTLLTSARCSLASAASKARHYPEGRRSCRLPPDQARTRLTLVHAKKSPVTRLSDLV
jgi:hypothetical protein